MNILRLSLLAAAVAALLPAPSHAADWPTRPVKLVVSYPAGGALDALARPFTEPLAKEFGQQFVIENRAGAAGALGTEAVAKSALDGYTFLINTNGALVLLPHLRKLPYAVDDVTPVAPIGDQVYAFGVLNEFPARTMKEMVEKAKANPGKYSYSSPGAGSITNLRVEAFKSMTGTDILHVPYRTGAEALIDFLGGRVDIMLDNVQFAHVKGGKAVLLAVFSDKRHPDFPDVPTMAEAGYPLDLPNWAALYAPKGTPPDIVEKLSAAVNKISATSDIQERLVKIGWVAMQAQPATLRERLVHERQVYGEWVKKLDFKIE